MHEFELIPAERVIGMMRRARRTIGAGVLSGYGAVFVGLLWQARFPGALGWLGLVPVALTLLVIVSGASTIKVDCPACGVRTTKLAYLKRTRRCARCRVVIMTPVPAEVTAGEERRMRSVRMRIWILLGVTCALVPIGIAWMTARQWIAPAIALWESTLIVWCLIGLVLGLPLIFDAWAARLKARRVREDVAFPPRHPVLTVLEMRRGLQKVYRVYFTERMICFARVGGMFYSEERAPVHGEGGWLLLPLLQRMLRQKRRREAVYDSIDPASADFLALDTRNFQVGREEVRAVTYWATHRRSRRENMPYGLCAGVLAIAQLDGPDLRFGVVDDLSEAEVTEVIGEWARIGAGSGVE